MNDFLLDFKFKGDRNYVHGTDIYSKLMEHLSGNFELHDIDLSFHEVITSNLKAKFFNSAAKGLIDGTPASFFKFTSGNERYTIQLVETGELITGSYEYDEDKIGEGAIFYNEEKTIELNSLNGYTNVEQVVALNKSLLNKLFTDAGKWYFTKIAIKKDINIERPGVIKIRLVNNIGSKITKSLIFFDGEEKGFIWFSKV